MHCEGGYAERANTEPLFLREARRRVYSAVYRIDKTLAIFFGRPPMIGWRYSDRKQLLDVSDDVIVSENPEIINKALSRLDGNGWNTDGHIHPSTCIRLRCQHAVFKERLLEQSLSGEKDSDITHNMRYVSIASQLRFPTDGSSEQYQPNVHSTGRVSRAISVTRCTMTTRPGTVSEQVSPSA